VIIAQTGRQDLARSQEGLAADVFRAFPYGIIVVDERGAVIAANQAAVSLVGGLTGDDGRPRHSCDLLGCRRPGPLHGVCLTALAAERRAALPEIRLDLPSQGPAAAAWVTAAPLRPDGSSVVVELRPGDAHDRRRRTEPHWTSGAELRIHVLGGSRVESHEGPIGGHWLEQRPGQILKYLLTERDRVVLREEIAETIWPGADPRVLGRVRHFMHALRVCLEPGRAPRDPSSFILSAHGGYALDRTRVWIDADEFEHQVRLGFAELDAGRDDAARGRLSSAMELYRGDFLADEPYADWAIGERDRLRRMATDALRALTNIERRADDLESAAAHMERLGDLDPFDVDVQREVILLCLARGRRSEAIRRHSALRMRILRTFGEDIGFTLADLLADGPDPAAVASGGG
jgi:DNA-binding SARP family transcriptional activator